jgi:hypothetical protein
MGEDATVSSISQGELLRTPSTRSSKNSPSTHSSEYAGIGRTKHCER